jgi:Na+-translocating ferredoxin:NAD+ oxidoreductase RnfG subunit
MENIMLTVKFAMFYGMQLVVVAIVGVTLIAGVYQLVRDKVSEARRHDQTAPKAH